LLYISAENTFNQLVSHIEESIDLSALAKELFELRQVIKDQQVSAFANAGGGTIAGETNVEFLRRSSYAINHSPTGSRSLLAGPVMH
jgi:hypothetical protein